MSEIECLIRKILLNGKIKKITIIIEYSDVMMNGEKLNRDDESSPAEAT